MNKLKNKIGKKAFVLWTVAVALFAFSLLFFTAENGWTAFLVFLVAELILAAIGYKRYKDYIKNAQAGSAPAAQPRAASTIAAAPRPAAPVPNQSRAAAPATADDKASPRKLYTQIRVDNTRYDLSPYHYDDVKLACCTMPEYAPSAATVKPFDDLVLKQEPENEFDHYAVAVLTKDGRKVGYLHKGKLQDMANDWIAKKKLPIRAFAVDSPLSTIQLGFYDLAKCEKNLLRLNQGGFETYKLTGSMGKDAQDFISSLNVGDSVGILYDMSSEKYTVTDSYGFISFGSFKSKKLDYQAEYDACVAAIDENDDGKSIVTVAIFNA